MPRQTLTEYELRRLENIRRNRQKISSLLLPSKASDLLQTGKPKPKPKSKPKSIPKPEPPIVLRRSSRRLGISPSADPTATATATPTQIPSPSPPRKRDHLLIAEAFCGPDVSDSEFLASIRPVEPRTGSGSAEAEGFDPRAEMVLQPENVERVVSERILSVRFLPVKDRTVLIVGNKIGNLGFWDADAGGLYVYHPHSAPVSGISVHPFSVRKIFTSSYDGFIRLMDVEKGTFNKLCSSDYLFFSICQSPHDVNSLYIGEGPGMVKVWDEREGKASNEWSLHADRINTIDFNPENVNLMVTSSTDGTARIWDLRSIRKHQPESLNSVSHHRAVHSAYFSPSGSLLATTSLDNKVGILSGANFDNMSKISHDNHTGRWLSSFRAIWGWDDSYLFLGNMKRAVDVISTIDETTTSLQSRDMTSIPCRFAAHPFNWGLWLVPQVAGRFSCGQKNEATLVSHFASRVSRTVCGLLSCMV